MTTCQSQITQVSAVFEQSHQYWQDVYQDDQPDGYLLRTRLSLAMELCRKHLAGSGRVLDLGCGGGGYSPQLSVEKVKEVKDDTRIQDLL